MSHSSEVEKVAAERLDVNLGRKLTFICFIIFSACAVFGAFGLVADPKQFAFSWLFGFSVVFTICVGALFWTILHTSTDSEWGVLVRRQMENIAVLIVFLPVLFVPLLFWCAPILWKWWNVGLGTDPLLDAKRPFLNHTFFVARVMVYFLSLGAIAHFLRKYSLQQDLDGNLKHTLLMRKIAVGGLPVLGVSLTFAAVDWLMGLDYHWFSTMWGVYIFAGAAGSSMAVLVLVVTCLKKFGYLKLVNVEHFHIMGKFLLAFTVFWAYIGYSQYMLIWYANIPEETIYFKIRNTESWHLLSSILVCGRFFLPFPVLLFQGSKKKLGILCAIAVWIIIMQILDLYIVVMPSLHSSGVQLSLQDVAALVGSCAFAGSLFFWRMCQCNLFPNRDPRLLGSVTLSN